MLSLASRSLEATIRHTILSLLLSGRKLFPLSLHKNLPPPFRPIPQTNTSAHFPRDAEIALGIMCSCMPILPKFFRHLVPKIKSRLSSYRRSKGERASSATSGGSISRTTTPWERYDDSRRLQSSSPAPDIEMVSLGQEAPMDTATTHLDVKENFGEMGHVVARDKRIGGDLEDGSRRWKLLKRLVFRFIESEKFPKM